MTCGATTASTTAFAAARGAARPRRAALAPGAEFERWEVSFSRGGQITSISGCGPLPSPVLVPWALIPGEGTETMEVRVLSYRQFRAQTAAGTGNDTFTSVYADAALEWSVRIIP